MASKCEPKLGAGLSETAVKDARSSVLANEDLLDLIFSFYTVVPLRYYGSATGQVGPYIFDAGGKKSDLNVVESRNVLLKASLTSKTFFYPAIRALWQSMDSIIPLVRLVSGVKMQGSELTTSMAMSEEDLQRFDFYARLVKTLVFSEEGTPRPFQSEPVVSPQILLLLHNHRPQGLLPSLKVLEINMVCKPLRPQDMWLVNSLIPLAGPLSQLVLTRIPDSTQGQVLVASIIKSVHMKSPRLISITLGEYQHWAISDVVRNIESLQSVSLDFRTSEVNLIHVPGASGSFSNIVNLYVVGSVFSVHLVLDVIFAGVLSQLKNLKISLIPLYNQETQWEELRALVNGITLEKTSPLESFVFEHELGPGGSVYVTLPLPDAWLQNFNEESCRKLKALSIPVENLTSTTFTLLFATPQQSLVWLDISSRSLDDTGFDHSAEVLKIVRDRLPNLKYLSVPIVLNTKTGHNQFTGRVSKESPSEHGLQELRLKSFGLFKSYRTYPQFHLPNENIADLLMIARYIDHLFPHLKKIDTGELRGYVQTGWLDGLETAVKQYGELRSTLKGRCEFCGK